MRRLLWAGLIVLACANTQADGLYRWVDKSGKVNYGDAPGAGAAKVEQKKFGARQIVPAATYRA
jgi:hypothetical protein